MRKTIETVFVFCVQIIAVASVAYALPPGIPHELSDQNVDIQFEVHSPWNILDGVAKVISGKLSLAHDISSDGIRANISVEKLKYKAGLSMAGRLVATWLEANPPTPAGFVVHKSSLQCSSEAGRSQKACTGSVLGQLTMWGKDHTIDVPLSTKPGSKGMVLTGSKEIKWGEYGFGDPDSTIAMLKPVIVLNFSINVPV